MHANHCQTKWLDRNQMESRRPELSSRQAFGRRQRNPSPKGKLIGFDSHQEFPSVRNPVTPK